MTQKKTTALDAHKQVEQAAHTQADRDVRTVDTFPVGKSVRQGDIYLTRIDSVPSAFTKKVNDRQLAPGNTQGSRHCLAAGANVDVFVNPTNNSPLAGPVISAKERFTLTHPEHADFDLPAGAYRITYQQDWAEEELRAVRD